MKHSRYLAVSVLVAFLLDPSPFAFAGPSEVSQISTVLRAQAEAWNRGDIDGYMNGYARDPGTEFVGGDTLTRGWQTVRDRYKKKYDTREKMGVLKFSELRITPLAGDAALVTGRWKLTRKIDKPHGRFTLLFRKRPEGWRIVHDHSSAAEK
ncbi:MAG: nuclear transport factor 2 family protein [Chthoniobacterales bacterium]